jgi:hypothetical protein
MDVDNPAALLRGIQKKNLMLTQKNDEYLSLMEKRAHAERDYKIAFAKTLLEFKPDHPATILIKVVDGDSTVADLKFKLDVADAVVRACRESMDDIRTAIDSYRSALTWKREELHRS